MSTLLVDNVVDQHLEEAAFLAGLRDYAVRAPHYDLKHLQELEQRLDAHLDGLRIAGPAALQRLATQLHPHAGGELFVYAVLILEQGDTQAYAELLRQHGNSADAERALASALGWLAWAQVGSLIERMLASADPLARRLGLAASGMHRQDPGPALLAALAHADPAVLARAARCAGELRRHDLMAEVRRYRTHEDPALRFWSAWATAQMGDEEALPVLRQFAEQSGPWQLRALPVLLAWQPRETSMAWIRQLTQEPARRRLAIRAAGLFGDPQTLPWLIRQMAEPAFARAAGEAFSLITGVDLAEQDLELASAPDYDAGPTDDPNDPNVEMDPDSDLAWPDPVRVGNWWQHNAERFPVGTTHLLGAPLSEARCRDVLASGWQHQRLVAASLLARFQPKQALFPCSAPTARQRTIQR